MKLALLIAVATATALFYTPVESPVRSGWIESQCLATAIHYEARGEPIQGRRAVLDVIANRMMATGKSACGVVFQHGQFSWTKSKPLLDYTDEQREKLGDVLKYPRVLISEKHLYFYSGEKPYWAYDMACRKINRQQFCKGK